jgi:hypothetical protein
MASINSAHGSVLCSHLAASLALLPLVGLAVRAPGCKPELGARLRSCAHKSTAAQLSLSALCEAAEEAVVVSAVGCTDVILTIC